MERLTIGDALTALARENSTYLKLLSRPALDVALYKPEAVDPQTPHLRDEIYVIASGSGCFIEAGESQPFAPGDLFFVPRGVAHRFVDFTADFSTWVIFLGEVPKPATS
jgi:mannose-6-phosphate isomerase-like protein (cupin superfamily)